MRDLVFPLFYLGDKSSNSEGQIPVPITSPLQLLGLLFQKLSSAKAVASKVLSPYTWKRRSYVYERLCGFIQDL